MTEPVLTASPPETGPVLLEARGLTKHFVLHRARRATRVARRALAVKGGAGETGRRPGRGDQGPPRTGLADPRRSVPRQVPARAVRRPAAAGGDRALARGHPAGSPRR